MSSEIEPKTFGEKVEKFLREKHPVKTAANVAADTEGRCNAFQVSKWLEGTVAPGGAAIMSLLETYGPEFIAAVIPSSPLWLDAAVLADRTARLEAEIADRKRQIEELKTAL